MYRELTMKYIVKLNDDVTNEMLEEKGFKIEQSKNFLWAVKDDTGGTNMSKGSIIIKLNPPERRIVFRFQSDDLELDLLEEVNFMKGMYTVENK